MNELLPDLPNAGSKGLSYGQLQLKTKAMQEIREKRKKDNYQKIRDQNVKLYGKLANISTESSQISNLNNALIVKEKIFRMNIATKKLFSKNL